VDTVRDAYMCASGVPIRNPNHASELADMALHIRTAVSEFEVCKTVAEASLAVTHYMPVKLEFRQ